MIVDFFNAVSTDVVARMAAEGMPALVDSACLLGPENAPAVLTSAAPRITFVPMGGSITKRAPRQGFVTGAYQSIITQPWIWTDVQMWRVDIEGVQYASGVAASDLTANWDWVSAMMYVVIQSLTALCDGCWIPSRYEWADSKNRATTVSGFGRLLSMFFDLEVPVLLYNLPAPSAIAQPGLPLIPASAHGTIDIGYVGGPSGDEIQITVPEKIT